MPPTDTRSLYFDASESVEIRTEHLDELGPAELHVETIASGISPGSELLVYRGEFPDGVAVDSSIDALGGEFEYPLRYGCAAVGEVTSVGSEVDGDWLGRRVFAFVPHASQFRTTPEAAGPVGRCTTHLLSQFPLDRLVVVEPIGSRRELARGLGADRVVAPEAAGSALDDTDADGTDLVCELSGQLSTLDALGGAAGGDGLVYAPLTFDGETVFLPEHPADEQVVEAFHAAIDAAPGRDSRAGRRLLDRLRERGARVEAVAASDWIVRPSADERYFLACILGFAADAIGSSKRGEEWLETRRRQLRDGELTYVAHGYDLLWRPRPTVTGP